MGLVELSVDRKESGGREKKVETTFEPRRAHEAIESLAVDAE